MTSLNFTQANQRLRGEIERCLAAKPTFLEGFDRVVMQNVLDQAFETARTGTIPEFIAMTDKLRETREMYTPHTGAL